MEIYLLRHGTAENAHPGLKDSERALTEEGREKLRRVLRRARAAGVQPELILSSPYRRALETAAAAAEVFHYQDKVVQTAALTPEAPPRGVWDEIRNNRNAASVLLAGHEPLMSSLLAFLLNCPALLVDVKKSALARVDCEHFGPEPRATLKWMLTPRIAGE